MHVILHPRCLRIWCGFLIYTTKFGFTVFANVWSIWIAYCSANYSVWNNNILWHQDARPGGTYVATRRSENDNTPQPLDQWTNSSFIGQQVGNCKSFTLTHYFADLSAMHRGRRSIPLCIQHHIQLTSLSFQVSQTSHCWVTAISIFYLENPRSRSWVRSKFEVTMWV